MNTSVSLFNVTEATPSCQVATGNPWCDQSQASKVIEIIYLTLVSIVGTLGNLLVIFSIILLGKTHQNGNMFLVNLAIADLLMVGIFVPLIIPNVYNGYNALSPGLCNFSGFIAILSGACSLQNLAAVSANRYWAISRHASYSTVFSKRRVYVMVSFTWFWAFLLTLPPLANFGNIDFRYDKKAMACVWSMFSSMAYDICLMIFGILLPLTLICIFYWELYKTVRQRRLWLKTQRKMSSTPNSVKQYKRSLDTEINLLKTLAVTVLVFILCWAPYGITVLIGEPGVPPLLHKAFGWLTSTNSSLNFIIYGVMNRNLRMGYKRLLGRIFRTNNSRGPESSRSSAGEQR